ncbi:MAG: hypothetical protein ACPLYF_04905 [Fervidobacterium sp.]
MEHKEKKRKFQVEILRIQTEILRFNTIFTAALMVTWGVTSLIFTMLFSLPSEIDRSALGIMGITGLILSGALLFLYMHYSSKILSEKMGKLENSFNES